MLWSRADAGANWVDNEFNALNAALALDGVGVTLPLGDIYLDLTFEDAP